MLRVLTDTIRRRAGRILALMYLACVVGPVVALAFADAAGAAHGLTADHAAAAVHMHSDGTVHSHDHSSSGQQADIDSKDMPGQCCGLFCLTAMAGDSRVAIVNALKRSRTLPTMLEAALGGLGPFRIDRPPIVLASL